MYLSKYQDVPNTLSRLERLNFTQSIHPDLWPPNQSYLFHHLASGKILLTANIDLSDSERAGWQLLVGVAAEVGMMEGLSKKEKKKENSWTWTTVWWLPKGGGEGGEEEGEVGEKYWWKETWLGVVSTQYSVQMMYYSIVLPQ